MRNQPRALFVRLLLTGCVFIISWALIYLAVAADLLNVPEILKWIEEHSPLQFLDSSILSLIVEQAWQPIAALIIAGFSFMFLKPLSEYLSHSVFAVSVRTGATQIQSSEFFTKENLAYYLWWDLSTSPYVEHADTQRFKTFFEKTAPRHTELALAFEKIRPFLPRLDLPGVPTYYPSEMGIESIKLKTNILVANSGHAPIRIKLPQECMAEIADRRVDLPPGWKCTYELVMEGSDIQIDPENDYLISASCWLKVSESDTDMGSHSDWGKYGFRRVRASRNFVQFLRTETVRCGPCVIHLLDSRSVRFTLEFDLASELRSINLAEVEIDRLEKQWKVVAGEFYKYKIAKSVRPLSDEFPESEA